MAVGIIVHVSVGNEKRTEFFGEDRIRFGSGDSCELQIHTSRIKHVGKWLELELTGDVYRVINFAESVKISLNGEPLKRFVAIKDGDVISLDDADIRFSFFSLTSESALITTNRDPHVAPFIEEAAIGAASTEKRDDAKSFLREFSRELLREISWTSKLIALVLAVGIISGIFYLGFGVYREMQLSRELAEKQGDVVNKLRNELDKANEKISEVKKTGEDVIKTISLAPNLRVEYGNGVCLIVGVYDLVDPKSGRVLRYPDPNALRTDPYEPGGSEEGMFEIPDQAGLTVEGNGAPVEYDFIGTGFHVGGGFIVTNRHVLQPWSEDDLVKQLMRENGGRARVKRLSVYFPNRQTPLTLSIKKVSNTEDLAVAAIGPEFVTQDMPVLPLDSDSSAVAIGKTVVTMGYPNGPDRLLAMVDDREAKMINQKYGRSRQVLINYLAQSKKITPLMTQGAITDLDSRRVVHDAKTAEGGSGAPLFGQSGKVIGVNFGVFRDNDASNMAIPIRYSIKLLESAGWRNPDKSKAANSKNSQTASVGPGKPTTN